MEQKNIFAFTLVELIVVITIVWILSTVGFVSYSGYLTGARDSNRFSQLTKLSDSLQTYAASKSLPLPDDYIEITASGASNVIAYQWYVWVDVLETIDYTNGGKDPKDDSYFTYYLTKDRKSLQLLAFMEDSASVSLKKSNNTAYAADYSERFTKVYGQKLWVLTQGNTNIPAQEISSIISGSGYLDIYNSNILLQAHFDNQNINENIWILKSVAAEGWYHSSTEVWLDMETLIWVNLKDISWNWNDALRIWSSIIVWWTGWVIWKATHFWLDGWFQIPYFEEIESNNMTISLWSKTSSIWNAYSNLINQWDCSGDSCYPPNEEAWWFGLATNNNNWLRLINSPGNWDLHSNQSPVYWDWIWHNYSFTKEGNLFKLFIDGKKVSEVKSLNKKITNNIFPIYIADSWREPSYYDNWVIDEIRIFSKALSESDIQKVFRGWF